jgi:hypothetical protein
MVSFNGHPGPRFGGLRLSAGYKGPVSIQLLPAGFREKKVEHLKTKDAQVCGMDNSSEGFDRDAHEAAIKAIAALTPATDDVFLNGIRLGTSQQVGALSRDLAQGQLNRSRFQQEIREVLDSGIDFATADSERQVEGQPIQEAFARLKAGFLSLTRDKKPEEYPETVSRPAQIGNNGDVLEPAKMVALSTFRFWNAQDVLVKPKDDTAFDSRSAFPEKGRGRR